MKFLIVIILALSSSSVFAQTDCLNPFFVISKIDTITVSALCMNGSPNFSDLEVEYKRKEVVLELQTVSQQPPISSIGDGIVIQHSIHITSEE